MVALVDTGVAEDKCNGLIATVIIMGRQRTTLML